MTEHTPLLSCDSYRDPRSTLTVKAATGPPPASVATLTPLPSCGGWLRQCVVVVVVVGRMKKKTSVAREVSRGREKPGAVSEANDCKQGEDTEEDA